MVNCVYCIREVANELDLMNLSSWLAEYFPAGIVWVFICMNIT